MAKQMRYLLKTDGYEFEVAKAPTPRMERNGTQKIDKASSLPVWELDLLQLDVTGEAADKLTVSIIAARPPEVRWRQAVEIDDLEIFPWAQQDNGGSMRSGVAFRIGSIRPVA